MCQTDNFNHSLVKRENSTKPYSYEVIELLADDDDVAIDIPLATLKQNIKPQTEDDSSDE